jgi:hypothetical protein
MARLSARPPSRKYRPRARSPSPARLSMLAPADDDRLLGETSKSAANVGLRLTAIARVRGVDWQLRSKRSLQKAVVCSDIELRRAARAVAQLAVSVRKRTVMPGSFPSSRSSDSAHRLSTMRHADALCRHTQGRARNEWPGRFVARRAEAQTWCPDRVRTGAGHGRVRKQEQALHARDRPNLKHLEEAR